MCASWAHAGLYEASIGGRVSLYHRGVPIPTFSEVSPQACVGFSYPSATDFRQCSAWGQLVAPGGVGEAAAEAGLRLAVSWSGGPVAQSLVVQRGWDDDAGNLAAKLIGFTLRRLRAVAKDATSCAPKPVL